MVWTDELTGAIEQENFLLDKGRLKLKTIQKAFSASLVRMSIGKKIINTGNKISQTSYEWTVIEPLSPLGQQGVLGWEKFFILDAMKMITRHQQIVLSSYPGDQNSYPEQNAIIIQYN